ncbi:MAG: SDR family oxidoreductase [Novosphingobium sp.]|nr:SDR family oxidoreductase [Novosphingobium sp.]
MPSGRHAGKVAVCVGSATGMGAQSAYRLAMEGARVIIGDINVEAAEILAQRIRGDGGKAEAERCDIVSEDEVNALIGGAAARHGGLDLMHVNAADLSLGPVDRDALSTDLAVFDRTLEVGLRGHLLCTRAAIPLMRERGKGAIVYTSSDAAKTGAPFQFSYYVAKAGLNGLMRHVATRWGKKGIRANAICPGLVLTETVLKTMSDEVRNAALNSVPFERLGSVDDIANLVAFLLSDESGWINGQAISIDGGSVMHG